jgi:hypothetical protein
MAEEADVNLDTENEATEEVVKTEEAVADTESEPEFTESEKKLYARTKKAEADAKLAKKELAELKKKPEVKSEKSDFDLEDVAVLVQSVPVKEDRELVKKYAKFQGFSLEEALKDPVIKTLLKEKAEERKTSEVTNTSGSKRTSQKMTDEQIIQNAAEGKNFDPEVLAEARMNEKKAKFEARRK